METLTENKKAGFSYSFQEKFEAGISLLGPEVKSAKLGRININSAYVSIQKEEAYLLNASIAPYQPNNMPRDYNPTRPKKLLLKRQEIKYLLGKTQEKGLTLVPIKVYTKKGKIKLEFALAKGKKLYDKREDIRRRDDILEIARSFKY
ncbi:MAG TPA: SsrA-binding protein SmpB [Candidatus Pacearchaeota archaeon]|nr:SsrA-binding protein SmpB [Candidatus Pacearchaeota archaeon]